MVFHTQRRDMALTSSDAGMFLTLLVLFLVHRRQRDAEREKRLQYWREQVRPLSAFYYLDHQYTMLYPLQNAFRQNIMSMRDTARASIFSMSGAMTPQSNRTTLYSQNGGDADSTAPMLYKSSGLRQGYVNEDGRTDREESMYDDQSRDGSEAMYVEPKRF